MRVVGHIYLLLSPLPRGFHERPQILTLSYFRVVKEYVGMDREEDQTPIEDQSAPGSLGDPAPGASEHSMSSPINWDEDEPKAEVSHDERPTGLMAPSPERPPPSVPVVAST